MLKKIKELLEKEGYKTADLGGVQGISAMAFSNGENLIHVQLNYAPDEEELEAYGFITGTDTDFGVKK